MQKKHFVQSDPELFSKVVQEQNSRPTERRCPLARASNEVVELLSEYWGVLAPGCMFFLSMRLRGCPDNVVALQMRLLPPSSPSSSTSTRFMPLLPTSSSRCGMRVVLR